ncbi:hypothetical protein BHE74_00041237 [Ensete ventricosum]|nr:hypothetical protein GW17_00037965 [Ensete ventricosum]RWW52341.1 hypothetical protein BHE74_00041237 [Ensete ventricosum]
MLLLFVAVTTVASLHRHRCSLLLLAAVAVAAAPLAATPIALGQVSSLPRFYCFPLSLPLSLPLLSVTFAFSQRLASSLLLTIYC